MCSGRAMHLSEHTINTVCGTSNTLRPHAHQDSLRVTEVVQIPPSRHDKKPYPACFLLTSAVVWFLEARTDTCVQMLQDIICTFPLKFREVALTLLGFEAPAGFHVYFAQARRCMVMALSERGCEEVVINCALHLQSCLK